MPRPPRLHAPSLVYHVFARGNNKEPIFFDESNYIRFLSNLERFRSSLDYILYTYCLLPNHFHLLLQVNSKPLSKIMQVLLTGYTMYINKKNQRVGHLFQGRFQSIIVEKEEYLLQVLRYIHLNPVKANLVENPEDYLWSSYKQYMSNFQSSNRPELAVSEILGMFSQNTSKQKQLFHEFTLAGIYDDFDPFKKQVRGVLGDSKFHQKLTKVLKGNRP